jgi:hypothetical protein
MLILTLRGLHMKKALQPAECLLQARGCHRKPRLVLPETDLNKPKRPPSPSQHFGA